MVRILICLAAALVLSAPLSSCSSTTDTVEVTPKACLDALDAAEDLFTRDRAEVGPALDGVGSGETFEAVQKYSKAAHACRGLAGTP